MQTENSVSKDNYLASLGKPCNVPQSITVVMEFSSCISYRSRFLGPQKIHVYVCVSDFGSEKIRYVRQAF